MPPSLTEIFLRAAIEVWSWSREEHTAAVPDADPDEEDDDEDDEDDDEELVAGSSSEQPTSRAPPSRSSTGRGSCRRMRPASWRRPPGGSPGVDERRAGAGHPGRARPAPAPVARLRAGSGR